MRRKIDLILPLTCPTASSPDILIARWPLASLLLPKFSTDALFRRVPLLITLFAKPTGVGRKMQFGKSKKSYFTAGHLYSLIKPWQDERGRL
jgi:hypothetical protein